jgi:hypothetical protein
MQALDPDWQIVHARERMMESFGEKLRLMATCLWDVNEFEGDSLENINIKCFKQVVMREPQTTNDYLRHWVHQKVYDPMYSWRPRRFWHWVRKKIARRVIPHFKVFRRYMLSNEHIASESIQSSILAQMFWLRERALEPRAVVVHPEIKELLTSYPPTYMAPLSAPAAAWGNPDSFAAQMYEPEMGFCGLRVIVNPNMRRWGAYVV